VVKFDWQHSTAQLRIPLYRRKDRADISYTSRVMADFVSNFVAMATRATRVRRRVDFKMATLVYLSLCGMAPAHLAADC